MGLNSLANGIIDAGKIYNNDFSSVGSYNLFRDSIFEPVASGTGYLIGSGVDYITNSFGYNTNYQSNYSTAGKTIGDVAYYATDIYGGVKGVYESLSEITQGAKTLNLWSTYEMGNPLDGYTTMRDLKLTIDAPSFGAKAYAGFSGFLDGSQVIYNIGDVRTDFGNSCQNIWDYTKRLTEQY